VAQHQVQQRAELPLSRRVPKAVLDGLLSIGWQRHGSFGV